MGLRDWLQLCRISNTPTIVSNVMVGCAIGVAAGGAFPWLQAAMISVAMLFLYVAGMALNDVCDAAVDRVERPERPIPSGRITRQQAAVFVVLSMVLALALLSFVSQASLLWGLALTAAIIAYDTLHHLASPVALLMGVCRGLIYVTAAVAVNPTASWEIVLLPTFLLTLYVMLLTLVSQAENSDQLAGRAWLSLVILVAALVVPPVWLRTNGVPLWAIIPGVLLACWLLRACHAVFQKPPRTKLAILTWLSGLCLMDAYILAVLDWPLGCGIAILCFLLTVRLHRRIIGT